LKTNENIDERDNKKPEELPNKLQRQNSRQSTASAPSAVTTNKSSASASTDNTATVTAAVVPVTSAVAATPTMQVESNIKPNKASTKSNIKGFEDLFNLLIEKISSNGSASVSGSIIEKSIEDVISKINPDTVGISEILENNLGKNIHILIVLLDELCNLPSLDSSIESEVLNISLDILTSCSSFQLLKTDCSVILISLKIDLLFILLRMWIIVHIG